LYLAIQERNWDEVKDLIEKHSNNDDNNNNNNNEGEGLQINARNGINEETGMCVA
jgi:hypothetical protein